MFCMKCGTQLPDEAKFCFMCGTPIGGTQAFEETNAVPSATGTKLVDAKCTNCGAKLEVDPNMKKATCNYCGAEFIVDQAINNYNVQVNGSMNIGEATINVQGVDKKNLLLRAQDFEKHNNFAEALNYYNRVLDIDFEDVDAKTGIDRVKIKMQNFIYLDEEVSGFFGKSRKRLTRDSLIIIDSNGQQEIYYFKKMTNITFDPHAQNSLSFNYPGKWRSVSIGGLKNIQIYNFIKTVLNGGQPSFQKL